MAKIIAVFGSSQSKEGSKNYEQARRLGSLLARKGFTVANGGYSGVMEASARGAREGGGKSIGVTVKTFRSKANPYITEELPMSTWQERVFKLMNLADGYVILEGGTGTLVELALSWEMANKRLGPSKPIVVLGDCFKETVKFLVETNPYIAKADKLQLAPSPEGAVDILADASGD